MYTYMSKEDILNKIEEALNSRFIEENVPFFDKVEISEKGIIRTFVSGIPEVAIKIVEHDRMFDYVLYNWNSSEQLFKFKAKKPYSTAVSLVDDICGTQNRKEVAPEKAIYNLFCAVAIETAKDYTDPNADATTKRGLARMLNGTYLLNNTGNLSYQLLVAAKKDPKRVRAALMKKGVEE